MLPSLDDHFRILIHGLPFSPLLKVKKKEGGHLRMPFIPDLKVGHHGIFRKLPLLSP
jgi:hypothetical protein